METKPSWHSEKPQGASPRFKLVESNEFRARGMRFIFMIFNQLSYSTAPKAPKPKAPPKLKGIAKPKPKARDPNSALYDAMFSLPQGSLFNHSAAP